MLDPSMRNRPERYEETVDPGARNPAQHPAGPVMVAGLWYYLAPLGILLLLAVLVFFYWGDSTSRTADEPLEPTTGFSAEPTPGGGEPSRGYDTTGQEREYRGGN